ncbi:hypothetical protein AOQ84DRAFT_361062 [Glonium stellatum]|uniref:Uncharacterized protein n=1 Tax=Glonium stellatum TaxID=574774 RepID=A0A8E2F7G3_9PEZI|nr:hypothetical protein AOQ84DRAFT_361062 [Glonium stellatum]
MSGDASHQTAQWSRGGRSKVPGTLEIVRRGRPAATECAIFCCYGHIRTIVVGMIPTTGVVPGMLSRLVKEGSGRFEMGSGTTTTTSMTTASACGLLDGSAIIFSFRIVGWRPRGLGISRHICCKEFGVAALAVSMGIGDGGFSDGGFGGCCRCCWVGDWTQGKG